jgi:hypothetical protein
MVENFVTQQVSDPVVAQIPNPKAFAMLPETEQQLVMNLPLPQRQPAIL